MFPTYIAKLTNFQLKLLHPYIFGSFCYNYILGHLVDFLWHLGSLFAIMKFMQNACNFNWKPNYSLQVLNKCACSAQKSKKDEECGWGRSRLVHHLCVIYILLLRGTQD